MQPPTPPPIWSNILTTIPPISFNVWFYRNYFASFTLWETTQQPIKFKSSCRFLVQGSMGWKLRTGLSIRQMISEVKRTERHQSSRWANIRGKANPVYNLLNRWSPEHCLVCPPQPVVTQHIMAKVKAREYMILYLAWHILHSPSVNTIWGEFWTLDNVLEDAVKNHRVCKVPSKKRVKYGTQARRRIKRNFQTYWHLQPLGEVCSPE